MGPAGPRHQVRIERAKDAQDTLRRLGRYFGPYQRQLALVGLAVVAYTALGLLGPY